MRKCELLAPVGDFECLKAAVQNGADSVYLGASFFSARASAKNFDLDELKQAIEYAKLRNVQVHLALNTLIKNDELSDAISLATTAYNYGVDAIIVQDFGLANYLIKNIPELPIHASTQMTIHNLESVKELEKLGFSRAVLSRELSLNEIKYITSNSNIEIEAFVHGALCISYSGQCLLSSAIGGRSGNRGRCAGTCRLPYNLVTDDNKTLNSGYILSTKDLCSLEYLPELINAGVTSFKIEGRMKTPEYVATVTRIYRKYIDKVLKNEPYSISKDDIQELEQVFNRGYFSTGHLSSSPNQNLIYKDTPSHLGIYVGEILNFNENKGYIKLKLESTLAIGDRISINGNNYTVSELMHNNNNLKIATHNTIVTIGRMKGEIKKGNKIIRISQKALSDAALKSYDNVENKKIMLSCNISIKEFSPIVLTVKSLTDGFYKDISTTITSSIIPEQAKNAPITHDRIQNQLSKTGNTEFEFKEFNIDLGDNLYIPSISSLNELRRQALANIEKAVLEKSRKNITLPVLEYTNTEHKNIPNKKISILLNLLNDNFNYKEIKNVDKIYIPLKYWINTKFEKVLIDLTQNNNCYIYMPTIVKEHYKNIIDNKLDFIIKKYQIKGFVVSHFSQFDILKKYNLELIGNYTLNLYNNLTSQEYLKYGLNTLTLSPELSGEFVNSLQNNFESEYIVYGKLPVMTMNYCPLGESNKCYPNCKKLCQNNTKYYLSDRMNFKFRLIPDNIETITTLYNSKITSAIPTNYEVNSIRLDFIDEDINEINSVINTFANNQRLEGKNYTNGITIL